MGRNIDRTYALTREQQQRLRQRDLERQRVAQQAQQQLEQRQLQVQRLRDQELERRWIAAERTARRIESERNDKLEEAREAVKTMVRMNTKRKAMNVLKDKATRNRRLYSSIMGEINNDKRKAKYDELTNREIENDRKSRAEGELLYRQHTESVQNRKDAKERADIAIAELARRNAELEARHLRESLKNRRESKEREDKAVAEWEARHYRESKKSREEAKERENMALHQKYWSDHQAEWNRLERERQVPHGERENRWTFWEPQGERENPWLRQGSEEPRQFWEQPRDGRSRSSQRRPFPKHPGKSHNPDYIRYRSRKFASQRRKFREYVVESPEGSPRGYASPPEGSPRGVPSPPRDPSPPQRDPSPPRPSAHADSTPEGALRSQITKLIMAYPGTDKNCRFDAVDAMNDIIAFYNDSSNRGLYKKTLLKYHPDKNTGCKELATELTKIISNIAANASGKKGKKSRKRRRRH